MNLLRGSVRSYVVIAAVLFVLAAAASTCISSMMLAR